MGKEIDRVSRIQLEATRQATSRDGIRREILAAEREAVSATASDAARRALELYARIARPKPHNIDRGVVQTNRHRRCA